MSGQRSSRPLPNGRCVKVGPRLLEKPTSLNDENITVRTILGKKEKRRSEPVKSGTRSLAPNFSLLLKSSPLNIR